MDYGVGNIRALVSAYQYLNVKVNVCGDYRKMSSADRLILPGVGSFDWAMSCLGKAGLKDSINEHVEHKKKPILGICVGMQMMGMRSEEGELEGLGWIDGEVKNFQSLLNKEVMPIPHLGWNNVRPKESPLFAGLKLNRFYFLHSYFFLPKDKNIVLATSEYHAEFPSAINKDNIYGVQFHPEKSHSSGLCLLKNFSEI